MHAWILLLPADWCSASIQTAVVLYSCRLDHPCIQSVRRCMILALHWTTVHLRLAERSSSDRRQLHGLQCMCGNSACSQPSPAGTTTVPSSSLHKGGDAWTTDMSSSSRSQLGGVPCRVVCTHAHAVAVWRWTAGGGDDRGSTRQGSISYLLVMLSQRFPSGSGSGSAAPERVLLLTCIVSVKAAVWQMQILVSWS